MADAKFPKIDAFISKQQIKPSDCLYHTTRHVEVYGVIRVLVLKVDGIARCEYVCPSCKKYGYSEEVWKRPFSVKCVNCGYNIKVPKMQAQFKREMKAGRAKG